MCILTSLFALFVCTPCRAQPELHWSAPERCPQAAAFEAALAARFKGSAALLSVERIDATLTRAGRNEFQLTLSVWRQPRQSAASRRLSAHSCAELLAPAVWFVALAAAPMRMQDAELSEIAPPDTLREFEPGASSINASTHTETYAAVERSRSRDSAAAAAPIPHGEPSYGREDAEPSSPAAERDPERAPRPQAPWHVRLAGLAGVVGGVGATAQGMVGAATSVSYGVSHTQLSVSELLPAEHAIAHAGHVQVWSLEARLSECALWGRRLQAGPCAGIALLRTTAHSRDFGHDVHRVLLWGLAELGVRFAYPVTNAMELSLAGAIGTPLTPRPSFTVESVGAVATAARWSQAAQLGLIYVVR